MRVYCGRMRVFLIVALLLSGCGNFDPGEAICGAELRPGPVCHDDGRSVELVTSGGAWASAATCAERVYLQRWAIDGQGEMALATDAPRPTLEDLGGPSYCTPEGVPLCADGGAPVCIWSAVPDQDWLGTCRDLMLEAGVTEADCTFPLALWPETTIDPALIHIENAR